jgi:transcriptional regulator with XRE-family HTH domain
MSNMSSKLYAEKTTAQTPSLASTGTTASNLSIVKEASSPAQPLIRNKVLIRKRKRSKHPLRELRIRKGCTLEELSEITKLSPSYLSRLESGSRRLNADIIQRLSLALSCGPAELLPHSNFTGTSYAAPAAPANMSGTTASAVDLPVYKLTGTKGAEGIIEKAQAEQWITRPSDFIGVQDAFACAVNDSQWMPRYMNGDRLLIHPTAPLKAGCAVLVTTKEGKAYIGTFKEAKGTGAEQDFIIETTFSAASEEITFKQKDMRAAYRITGTIDVA